MLFPCPMPFFRHLPFCCCPFPPSSRWGDFLSLLPQSTAAVFHTGTLQKRSVCSQNGPLASPSSVFCRQETTKQLFRDRTSPTILLFGISPRWSVKTTKIVPSRCQALSLCRLITVFEGRWRSGELSKPSKSNHKLKRESFTRREKEGKET